MPSMTERLQTQGTVAVVTPDSINGMSLGKWTNARCRGRRGSC